MDEHDDQLRKHVVCILQLTGFMCTGSSLDDAVRAHEKSKTHTHLHTISLYIYIGSEFIIENITRSLLLCNATNPVEVYKKNICILYNLLMRIFYSNTRMYILR